jgi:hypothetical protein
MLHFDFLKAAVTHSTRRLKLQSASQRVVASNIFFLRR